MLAHATAGADSTRAEIERAALRLFVTRGLRGTTVRDIAAGAGVAEGTLYRHWRSKRELARDVFRGCAESVAAALRDAAAAERTATRKLSAALRALFRCAREEVLLYELLVLPPHTDTRDFLEDASSPSSVLADLVRQGQRCGEFGIRIDPTLAAECIVGAVNRIAIYRGLGVLPRRLADYEKELLTVMLDNLKPPRRRRRPA